MTDSPARDSKTLSISVDLPGDLLVALDIPPGEAPEKAREWIALELFREGKISAGRAAQIVNMSKPRFLDLLGMRNIPYLDSTAGELAREVEVAKAAHRG